MQVWKSKNLKAGKPYWNMICAFNGTLPWARYVSVDPDLMSWEPAAGPAGQSFVRGIPPTDFKECNGAALFHRIPGSEAGGAEFCINANSGSQMYVGKYDYDAEIFTVIGSRQILDYSSMYPSSVGQGGYVWAAAGTNGQDPETDTGRLLTVAWVRGGGDGRVSCDEAKLSEDGCPSVVSLVRSISWDRKSKQLLSFPVVEYETLRNQTFIEGSTMAIAANNSKHLPVPAGVGSVDVLVSFDLVVGASGFGISVRSGDVKVEVFSVKVASTRTSSSSASPGFQVVVGFHAGPQPCVGARGKPRCTTPPTPPPAVNATVLVLGDETLDFRVLVDRPIVEIYVNRGRAAFVSADAAFSALATDITMFNKGVVGVTATNVSAHRMGCGWATTRPTPTL
jgi:sucrose-6-phosphate hydrolase SacC (GH32 family)